MLYNVLLARRVRCARPEDADNLRERYGKQDRPERVRSLCERLRTTTNMHSIGEHEAVRIATVRKLESSRRSEVEPK